MGNQLSERLASKTDRTATCWLWTGACNRDGYGLLNIDRRNRTTHRLAFELAHGPIPDGLCVLHHCDVRRCINPAHLFLGTRAENNADKVAKNRGHRPAGRRNGRAKLSEAAAAAIRADARTQEAIAADYGVVQSVVSRIKSGELWRVYG